MRFPSTSYSNKFFKKKKKPKSKKKHSVVYVLVHYTIYIFILDGGIIIPKSHLASTKNVCKHFILHYRLRIHLLDVVLYEYTYTFRLSIHPIRHIINKFLLSLWLAYPSIHRSIHSTIRTNNINCIHHFDRRFIFKGQFI